MKFDNKKFTPVCPHCEREMAKLARATCGLLNGVRVFCCPHCKKVLGMSSF